jgi:hypothetical protein
MLERTKVALRECDIAQMDCQALRHAIRQLTIIAEFSLKRERCYFLETMFSDFVAASIVDKCREPSPFLNTTLRECDSV